MKDVKVNGFSEITEQEKMDVDGGNPLIAVITGGACVVAGTYIFSRIWHR